MLPADFIDLFGGHQPIRRPASTPHSQKQSHKRTLSVPQVFPFGWPDLRKAHNSAPIGTHKPNALSAGQPEGGSAHQIWKRNPVPLTDSISKQASISTNASWTQPTTRRAVRPLTGGRRNPAPPASPTKYGSSRAQPCSLAGIAGCNQITRSPTLPLSRLYAPFPWISRRLMDTYSFQSVKAPR